MSFDSSHIWETGIQTYIAGLQHLAIAQRASSTAAYSMLQDSLTPQSVPTTSEQTPTPHSLSSILSSDQQDMAFASARKSLYIDPAFNPSRSSQSGTPAMPHTQVNHVSSPTSHAPSKQLEANKAHPASPTPKESLPEQADISSVPSSSSSLQHSSTVRNLYLCLAAHNGSALDTFLQGVADPSEWEVAVWQAPQEPTQGDAAQHYLRVAKQWQAEVGYFVSFTQAAGRLSAATWTRCALGCGLILAACAQYNWSHWHKAGWVCSQVSMICLTVFMFVMPFAESVM